MNIAALGITAAKKSGSLASKNGLKIIWQANMVEHYVLHL